MRIVALGGLLLLGACGGGGTTGTNYSEAPPMAQIVGTPAPLTNADAAIPSEELATMAGDNASGAAGGIPADVAAFQEKRDACDHWRGEEAYDADRKKQIDEGIAKNCAGTDAELSRLKAAHKGDVAVQKLLAGYETNIE